MAEEMTIEQQKAIAMASARARFAETEGGAAIGNPNIQRQGDMGKRDFGTSEPFIDIGGAAGIGAVLGGASSEILRGAGNVVGSLPYPAARTIGGAMTAAGDVLKAGGRAAPAIAGAISGASSETAGQFAEAAGASPAVAEGARIVGGFGGAGTAEGLGQVLKAYILTPSLSVASKAKKMAMKAIIAKIDTSGVESLSDKERAFVDGVTKELRGGEKSDAPLNAVAGAIDNYNADKTLVATQGLGNAQSALSSVGRVAPIPPATLSDTGEKLRSVITLRNAKAKEVNDALYKANEAARDQIVSAKEAAGEAINKLPEFKAMVKDLKASLTDGVRSPDVQKTYSHILSQIGASEPNQLDKILTQFGGPAVENKPITFQALDDVRRSLGEVFRGKPPEGYAAISASDARKYYAQISEIQKKYAGDAQERLLDDYARGKEGLEPFISARGRKATALDRYDEKQFATDASKLPETYFSSRASVRSLKQLTGDDSLVNHAATEFINNKLEGATAKQANEFMVKNREWLAEVPRARQMIEAYATKAAAAERGMLQAQEFAKTVASEGAALSGKRFPADRVRNLVFSGDPELWKVAGPAIAASPDGKANILASVRQVIADRPVSVDVFNRTIRPALKTSGLADDAALGIIEKKLADIEQMRLPEKQKLALTKRIALNAMAGYTAGGMARGAVETAKWVPQ